MREEKEAGAPGTAAIEIPEGERRLIPHVHIPHGKGFFGSPSEEQEMSWASTEHVQSAAASDMSPVARKARMRQAMQNMGSVPVMGEPVIVVEPMHVHQLRREAPNPRCRIFARGRKCN
jgi:hypothetical protein